MKRIVVAIASLLVVAGACVLPPIGDARLLCRADADCPTSQLCVQRTDDIALCRPAGEPCVATIGGVTAEQPDGTSCASVDGGICIAGACVVGRCGDGVVSVDETCDGGEGCRTDCSRCGDGQIDEGEGCDDGKDNSDVDPGACRTTCVSPSCGDGVRDPGEGCDDGEFNDDGADGACRTICVRPGCGNGIREDGETCDDGDANSDTVPGACRTTCVPGECGDGVIDPGEACDEGSDNSDVQPNACRTTCERASCGDRARDLNEDCDDGDDNSDSEPDACRTSCRSSSCGDAVIDTGERCDDGNRLSGDGCRADCAKAERCGDGIRDQGEACDDGNDNPRDGCRSCVLTGWTSEVILAGRSTGGEIALTSPQGVAVDAAGGLYVADTGGHRVLRLDPDGTIAVIAGTGAAGFSGDGGLAIAAELRGPTAVALSSSGQIFIADQLNDRVRVVDQGVIGTFAGGGDPGVLNAGDGGVATAAVLSRPRALAVDANRLLIVEEQVGRVRQVDLGDRQTSTLVGGGERGPIPDGTELRSGSLVRPTGVAIAGNDVLIVELQRLRRVANGAITTIAGGGAGAVPPTGTEIATSVRFSELVGVAVAPDGSIHLTDRNDIVIVTQSNGVSRVQLDQNSTFLLRPTGIAIAGNGRRFVADEGRHSAVRIETNGRPDTLLGTGLPGESPEGDLATTLTLIEPVAVAVRPGFDMLVADAGARRIYAIDDAGVVRTFAGTDDVLVPTTGTDVVKPRVLRQMVRRQNGRVVVIAEGAESDALLEYLPDGTNVVELPIVISGPATGGTGQIVDQLLQGSRNGATGRPLALLDDRVVVGVGSSLLVEQSDGSFVLHDLGLPVEAITVEATVDLELLHVVSQGQVFQVASLSPVTLLLETGAGVGEEDVAIAMHNGVLIAGSLKQGIVSAEQIRIPFGVGRSGDGGAPSASSVNAVSALVSEGPDSLLIVDRGARVVRRMTGTFSNGIIETIVGDVHPAGPGTIATGTPYAPRNLALRAPGSLILGGAQGRILELRFGAGQNVGVAVVAGHPSPALSPTPRVARFEGLFADAAAFSAVGQTLTVLNRTSVLTIDTSSEDRAAWTVSSTTAPTAFDGPMFIARHNDQILVSEARRSCVRAFVPGTSTLGSAPPLFGSCGEAGSFSGLLRNPGPLVVANSGAIYLADTGNNRVLRRDPDTGVISVVIGDGSPSSAGQGGPAGTFPVNAPGQLAVDAAGNLFIASSTTVRLVANVDGDTDADADDDVSTIYGLANRDTFPESESRCVAALTLDEQNDRLYIADACVGFVVSLDLVP